ncbi:hypothetical protein HPB47_012316, partial [Ixodes persulcatus]
VPSKALSSTGRPSFNLFFAVKTRNDEGDESPVSNIARLSYGGHLNLRSRPRLVKVQVKVSRTTANLTGSEPYSETRRSSTRPHKNHLGKHHGSVIEYASRTWLPLIKSIVVEHFRISYVVEGLAVATLLALALHAFTKLSGRRSDASTKPALQSTARCLAPLPEYPKVDTLYLHSYIHGLR